MTDKYDKYVIVKGTGKYYDMSDNYDYVFMLYRLQLVDYRTAHNEPTKVWEQKLLGVYDTLDEAQEARESMTP